MDSLTVMLWIWANHRVTVTLDIDGAWKMNSRQFQEAFVREKNKAASVLAAGISFFSEQKRKPAYAGTTVHCWRDIANCMQVASGLCSDWLSTKDGCMGRIAHVFRCVRAWLIWERIGTVAGPAAARAAQPITARAAHLRSTRPAFCKLRAAFSLLPRRTSLAPNRLLYLLSGGFSRHLRLWVVPCTPTIMHYISFWIWVNKAWKFNRCTTRVLFGFS